MAFDTVVDKAQLEGAITASANAIREKTGSTEMIPWDANTGFADAISAIEAGGGGEAVRAKKPVVLEVEKITSNTYDGSTSYTNEVFVMIDIYPQSGGTVKVTYGDLTKTITDDGTSAEPSAQQVYFGTFHGVSDEVETPASGTLTIEGEYGAFAMSRFKKSSKDTAYNNCVTNIISFGEIEFIPEAAFGATPSAYFKFKQADIPDSVKRIDNYAFAYCKDMVSITIPDSVTSFGEGICMVCDNLVEIMFPPSATSIPANFVTLCTKLFTITVHAGVTNIGDNAFNGNSQMRYVRILATTPPTIGTNIATVGESYPFEAFFVPAGCGEAYKTAEGWSAYADYILEESA